jgi:ABC-type bacteriocin/lantibiotic exporter with double-glycine peptidase domain
MNDAAKIIQVFQMLLAQLKAIVEMMPQLVGEDGRADNMGNQIQNYQTKIARLKNVLQKHKDHEQRQREIQKQNRENSRKL